MSEARYANRLQMIHIRFAHDLLPFAAGLLAACNQSSQRQIPPENRAHQTIPDHRGLLVAREYVPGYLASMSGLMTVRSGCAVLSDGRTTYYLVWPAGTHFTPDRRAIVVQQDDGKRAVYPLGRKVTLVGGGVSHVDGASPGYKQPGNPACKGPGWVVSATAPYRGETR